jgi:N-acyl-D-amino-acid deacylase
VVHLRNESDFVVRSLEEVLDFSRKTEAPVHISHLKVGGKEKAPIFFRLLDRIDDARQQGLEITFDQYPYTACSTGLYAILPAWVQEGGPEQTIARLKESSIRSRIRDEFSLPWERGENYVKAAGWDGIYITGVKFQDRNVLFEGKNLKEIAEIQGKDPAQATFDLLIEEDLSVSMVGFIIQEEAIEAGLCHPAQMIGTDGLLGKLAKVPHPRVYGTFPRVLGKYVREKKVITLEKAIQKMTSASCKRLGISDRGEITIEKIADLVVFNPDTIIDKATYEFPHQHPEGIPYVFVAGIPVIELGFHTGKTPGRVVRKGYHAK